MLEFNEKKSFIYAFLVNFWCESPRIFMGTWGSHHFLKLFSLFSLHKLPSFNNIFDLFYHCS